MRKIRYLFLILSALIAFNFTSLYSMGAKPTDVEIPVDLVVEKIHQYVSSTCLSPYISPGKGEFIFEGQCEGSLDSKDAIVNFYGGHFFLESGDLNAMFLALKDKATKEIYVKLLYLSNGDLVTPTLFFDIAYGPQLNTLFPEVAKLLEKGGYVHMDVLKKDIGKSMQKWTFCTPTESCSVKLVLKDDGKGGTYFSVFKD